jgi:hypothetical protein
VRKQNEENANKEKKNKNKGDLIEWWKTYGMELDRNGEKWTKIMRMPRTEILIVGCYIKRTCFSNAMSSTCFLNTCSATY